MPELGLGRRVAQRLELGLERAGLVPEPLLAQHHDLVEQAQLGRGIVGPVGLAQREPGEPFVLSGRAVDRPQDLGGVRAQVRIRAARTRPRSSASA